MLMRVALYVATIVATGLVLAADESAALPPAFVWKPVSGLVWRTHGSARIENGVLIAELDKVGNAYAQAEIDISAYDGKPYELCATVKAEGIADAPKTCLGYRFAVNYLDMSMGGNRTWPGGQRIVGDYGPGEVFFVDRTEKVRRKAFIQIGICSARGKVTCDLSSVRIREPQPLVPVRNAGYKVKYPERVKNLPRMRGVMLGNMRGDAWDNLQAWGANLVRYQFAIRGTGPVTNFEAYAEGFRKNTAKELDSISATLDAAKTHGMKVVLDAHYACGGTCSKDAGDPLAWNGDWRIFHDKRFAKLFAWSWQRIAERCKGRTDVVYGYDLMNEPHHTSPAIEGCDLVGLQEKIAHAIRAIDPDTPIIVESMYCDPGWFRSLSAIGLDNVIYQVHLYYPHDYTHQGILNSIDRVEYWPDAKKGLGRDFLRRSLKPVIDFQKEHDAKIFVGEFSVVSWAPNAEEYMRDCMSIFEELGWDWTFHAFREFQGWSVEHESISRGIGNEHFRRSASNPRMRVLKEGLKGGFAPGMPGAEYKPRAFKKISFSGNSLTRHGVSEKIGWTNDWGMAASCPEKDYVHLTVRALEAYGRKRPEYTIFPLPLEGGYADMSNVCAKAKELATWKPDLSIIALGENAHSVTNDANEAFCRNAYLATVRILQEAGATVVLRAPFWPNDRHRRLMSSVAEETGAIYVDVGDLGWKKGMSAKGLFWHGGVAMHPGDNGMIAIADRLVSAVYERQMADEAVHDK